MLASPGISEQGRHHGGGVLGLRQVTLDEAADDVHPVVCGPVRQRAAQRGRLHLLGRALLVRTRHRPVHHTAASELRRAGRALPGPAGALLPVRLAATATDQAARLDCVRALPGRGLLRHHHLVDQRDVDLGAEDLLRQLHGLADLAGGIHDLNRAHFVSPFADRPPASSGVLAALRTSTRPPLGPGTAPLISSRPRSVSTRYSFSIGVVVRIPPIRPAIRTPLKTRPGVAQAPMEPGERCLRWVPWEEDRPLKPCRFMTPAKPLPLLLAVTSTRSPAANVPALTSWPSV